MPPSSGTSQRTLHIVNCENMLGGSRAKRAWPLTTFDAYGDAAIPVVWRSA